MINWVMHPAHLNGVIALAAFTGCLVLLAVWLRVGPGVRLLAIPNARSSHSTPTPTGGGIAPVVVLLCVLLGYWVAGVVWAGWLALGGFVVALGGLIDDAIEIPAAVRLVVQCAVVGGLLWSSDALELLGAGSLGVLPPAVLAATLLVALVWFLNLFNFMDGIDGLATAQSGAYCLGASLLLMGDAGWYGGLLWAGFACSVAFGVYNAAPARVFMGDVGSAFWGLLLGVLALQLSTINALPLVTSLILLSAFWWDATYTLIVRVTTGQAFTQGHRSHLYQRLADRFGHGRTTLGYLLYFVLWLGPLAAWSRALYLSDMAAAGSGDSALASLGVLLLACLPVAIGCVVLNAGQVVASRAPGT